MYIINTWIQHQNRLSILFFAYIYFSISHAKRIFKLRIFIHENVDFFLYKPDALRSYETTRMFIKKNKKQICAAKYPYGKRYVRKRWWDIVVWVKDYVHSLELSWTKIQAVNETEFIIKILCWIAVDSSRFKNPFYFFLRW